MPELPRTQQATLGCGTLILIGLVVLFFTRPGLHEVEQEVRHLREDVGALKKSLEAQTKVIQELRKD